MSAFKIGDKVAIYATVTHIFNNIIAVEYPDGHARRLTPDNLTQLPTPPPPERQAAPREPVPDDARVGDVYGIGHRNEHVCRVPAVVDAGDYDVTAVTGAPVAGRFSRGFHAHRGWHLLERGPTPAPAPEPATMTAGEAAYRAYITRVLRFVTCQFSTLSPDVRDAWEAAAQAVLAPQPAPAAKGERETVWRVICNVTGKLKLDADFPTRGDAQCAAKFLKRWHLRRVTRRRAPR